MVGRQPASPATGSTAHDGTLTAKSGSPTSRTGTATPSASTRPWGDEDSPGARHRGRDRARARAVDARSCAAARSPRSASSRPARRCVEQGEPGDELFLLLDGVLVGRGRRRAARRARPRRHPRRAGRARGRRSAPRRCGPSPPCRRRRGGRPTSSTSTHSPKLAEGHRREDRPRSADAAPPLRRARVDAGRRARVRARAAATRRAWPSPTTTPRCRRWCSTRAPACGGSPTLLDGAPFRGTILLGHLHWDHTQGLPFFAAGDRPDAEVRLLIPAQGADPLEVLSAGMAPPHFPITPAGLRGTWTFGDLEEGTHDLEGFEVLAREIPHQGGRTFGYRVQRRPHVDRLPVRPRADRPGARPRGLGSVPRRRAGPGRRRRRAPARRAVHRRGAARRERRSGTRRPTTPCSWPERAGARRVLLFHHDPVAHRRRGRGAGRAAPAQRRRSPSSPPSRAPRSSSDRRAHRVGVAEVSTAARARTAALYPRATRRGSTPHTAPEEFGP